MEDTQHGGFLEDDDDIDSEGMDEFIVPEGGRRAPKRKRAPGLQDTGLDIEQQQNLEELFGADAPAAWFGEGSEGADDEYVESVLGSVFRDDLAHERREASKAAAVHKEQRRAAAREGRGAEAKLKSRFEPGALSKGFLSQADAVLAALDVPERMTVSLAMRNGRLGGSADATMAGLPEPVAEGDRAAEAAWAAEHLAVEMWHDGWDVTRAHVCAGPYFSTFADEAVYGAELPPPPRGAQHTYVPDTSVIAALTDSVQRILTNVLDLKQEVPMVWAHRRDDFSPALALCHVWRVVDLDERWVRLAASARMVGSDVNSRLASLAQMGVTEEAIAEATAALQSKEATQEDRVAATAPVAGQPTTAEHRSDLKQLQRLHSKRELLEHALAAVSPAAMESISTALRGHTNDEEGVADAGMAARLALVKAHSLKQAAQGASLAELLRCGGGNGRLAVYATLQSAAAAVISSVFTLSADDVAANIQARSQVMAPPHVDLEHVNSLLEAHVGKGFDSEEKVLKAARMCSAIDMATHPHIRQAAREVVRTYLHVSTTATARGATDMEPSHTAYGLQALRDKPLGAFHSPAMPIGAHEALALVDGFGGAAEGALAGSGVPNVDLYRLRGDTQQLLQEESHVLDEPVDEYHPRVETSVRLRRPLDGVVCGFGHGAQQGTVYFSGVDKVRRQLQNPLGLPPFGQEHDITLQTPRTGGLAQWLLLLRAEKEGMLKVQVHLGARGARMDGRTLGGIPPGPFMPGQPPPAPLALNRPGASFTEAETADLKALDGEAVLVAWLAPAVLSLTGLSEWVAQAAAVDGNGAPLLPPIVASRPQAGIAFPSADPAAPTLAAGACVPSVLSRVTFTDAADNERLATVRLAVRDLLLPELMREARKVLTKQAREAVVGQWACELRHRVLTAPFRRPPINKRVDPATDLVGGTLDMAVAQAAEEAAMAEEGAGRWDSRPRVLVISAPLPGVRDASVAASLGRDGRVLDMTPLPARKEEVESAIMECMIANPPDVVVVAPSGGMRVRWMMRDTVQTAARRAHHVIQKARKVVRETLRHVARSGGSLSAVVVGADSSQLNLESESIASVRAAVRGQAVAASRKSKQATGAGLFTPEAFVAGGRLAGLQHLVPSLTPWVMGGKWAKRFFRFRPAPPSVADPMAPMEEPDMQQAMEDMNAVNTLPILLGDGDVPPVLARSDVYRTELPDARDTMRLAVATGRYLQDPLVATSVLWPLSGSSTANKSAVQAGLASVSRAVLGLQLHPLQGMAPEARLLRAGERVMVEAVSAAGVDVNSVLRLPHAVPLLQFVPGLGPRKVKNLLDKTLSFRSGLSASEVAGALRGLQDRPQLRSVREAWPVPIVSRASLLENGWLTNTVYYNAASFLRIPDPVMLGAPLPVDFDDELDETQESPRMQRDPLDATSLHPDTYAIAAQLCGAVNANLPEAQRLSAVIDRADGDVDLTVPRSYRPLVRHVARYSRHCLVATLLEWTDGSTFLNFAEPVGDRQGQLVAGPHGSMPPEEYFPGALCEPGIVPDAKLHAEAKEQGVELAQPPMEPKDPLAAFDLHLFAKSLEDGQEEAGKTVRRTLHRLQCVVQQLRQPSVAPLLPFREPSAAAAFRMLSGESVSSLHPGTVVVGRVSRVMPHRVVVRLDCGVSGALNVDSVVDPAALPPGRQLQDIELTELFASGQNLQVRVCKVDYAMFNVTLTALPGRTSLPPAFPQLDAHVDPVALRLLEAAVAAELRETVADAQDERVGAFRARTANGSTRVLRPINHPSFKNMTSKEAEHELAEAPLYSYLVRPSSKGPHHLTITWKFADAPLFVHINVDEQDKDPNSPDGAAALGKTLVLGKFWHAHARQWQERKYEDLDELLAMYMERVSAFMRDFTGQSRFRAVPSEMLKQELLDMKAANPGHLPYLLHYGTGEKLGRVAITILVSSTNKKTHTEYVAVEPEGFRWAGAVSTSVASLLGDFKQRVLQVLRKRSAKSKQAASGVGSAASPGRSRWGGVASPGADAAQAQHAAAAYNAGMAPM